MRFIWMNKICSVLLAYVMLQITLQTELHRRCFRKRKCVHFLVAYYEFPIEIQVTSNFFHGNEFKQRLKFFFFPKQVYKMRVFAT